MRSLKTEGFYDYRTRIVRTDKFYHKIDTRLVLAEEQAKIILNDLIQHTWNIQGGITITKDAKIDQVDAEIDEIAQRILLELEGAKSKDLSDVRYARMILHLSDIHYTKRVLEQIGSVTLAESKIEKRAVIKVLLFSTWLQRLYFIIRAYIMGLIGSVFTFLFIWSVGTIDAITGYIFGIFVFVICLIITRLFDAQITQATKKIIELLANHRTVRGFIMNHF